MKRFLILIFCITSNSILPIWHSTSDFRYSSDPKLSWFDRMDKRYPNKEVQNTSKSIIDTLKAIHEKDSLAVYSFLKSVISYNKEIDKKHAEIFIQHKMLEIIKHPKEGDQFEQIQFIPSDTHNALYTIIKLKISGIKNLNVDSWFYGEDKEWHYVTLQNSKMTGKQIWELLIKNDQSN